MAEFIVMPKLGFDMREGVLNNWLKQLGESVTKGEIVAEIESDKATLELESQAGGVLLQFLADPGDVVPVGANLAIVGDEGEDIAELLSQSSNGKTPASPVAAGAPASEPQRESENKRIESPSSGTYPGGAKSTPVARRIAAELGVDLRLLKGSGPDGRIRKADVESYRPDSAPVITAQPTERVQAGPESEELPTSRLRQIIGPRMTESKTTVPHFYVTSEIDMAAALELRKQINGLVEEAEKITVNDLIVKAAALALRDFPNLNASYAGDNLVRHNRINVGSAVAVEGGLLTVVQQNTDISPLRKVAADNREMIGRARSGKIHPDDIVGGTFTVSNLGAFDVDHFIAIINPPDAAILAIGSAKQVPVISNGELAIGTRMMATISADHRVTDGAEAAQYMQKFKDILQEPIQLLL
jgi:pyruvate dehydrogenase E2 component (dihydrolipoamide acetyltransferase)